MQYKYYLWRKAAGREGFVTLRWLPLTDKQPQGEIIMDEVPVADAPWEVPFAEHLTGHTPDAEGKVSGGGLTIQYPIFNVRIEPA